MASFQVTEVQKHLKGAEYPATGAELATLAEDDGAPTELVDLLRDIQEVESPAEVMEQLEGHLGDDDSDDD